MARFLKVCFLVVLVFSIAGCATSRHFMDVNVPAASLVNPNGKQVFIRLIADNRKFEEDPLRPESPSLGFGGLDNVTTEMKNRAIARKRNMYGKAMGDILLDEGSSVQKVIYEATKNALYSLGYEVVDKQEEARNDAITMDISIDKFWAWFVPGFWAISLKSEITTTNTITVPKRDSPIVIMAEARNVCQASTDANWKKVYRIVIDNFITEAKTKLQGLE